jgi:hypothetical protein
MIHANFCDITEPPNGANKQSRPFKAFLSPVLLSCMLLAEKAQNSGVEQRGTRTGTIRRHTRDARQHTYQGLDNSTSYFNP